jgi:HK97 family phage major capsid protein
MSKQSAPPTAAIDGIKDVLAKLAEQNAEFARYFQNLSKPASRAVRQDGTPATGADVNKGFSVEGNHIVAPDGSRTPINLGKTIGWGNFLKDLHRASSSPLSDESQKLMEKHSSFYTKDLSSQGGSTGGYTIPVQFVNQLLTIAAEYAHIRPYATVMPMSSKTLQIPALDMTLGSAGQSPFLGGVVANWTEENVEKTGTEPAFKQVDLTAWELTLICNTSNTLVQDSGLALDAVLTSLFGMAIAWHEDYTFIRGDGVGKPLGMLNSAASLGLTRATSNSIRFADIANMAGRLLAPSMSRSIWLVSQTALPQLLQLQGANGDVVFIPNYSGPPGQSGLSQTMPGTLLGRPIIVTEKLPALGTAGDIMLVDPSMYLIGDRMEMALEASPHARFARNQTQWRAIKRVDGQPWLTAAPTLADGSTTVSPFVYLNA